MYGFKLKKTKWPCDLQGPLEGPRGAGHRQGPSGVDPKVKKLDISPFQDIGPIKLYLPGPKSMQFLGLAIQIHGTM